MTISLFDLVSKKIYPKKEEVIYDVTSVLQDYNVFNGHDTYHVKTTLNTKATKEVNKPKIKFHDFMVRINDNLYEIYQETNLEVLGEVFGHLALKVNKSKKYIWYNNKKHYIIEDQFGNKILQV